MYNRTCSTATERLAWKNNMLLFADLAGKDIKRIIAYELHHHRSCYCDYTREQRPITEVESTNQVIFNYVRERLIEGNEIIHKKDLLDAYKNSLPLEAEVAMDVKPIVEDIIDTSRIQKDFSL